MACQLQDNNPWTALEEGAASEVAGHEARRIRLGPGSTNEGFAGNSIRTAKYNIITFLPIFLWTMFKRVAYLYFLAQVSWCFVVSAIFSYC